MQDSKGNVLSGNAVRMGWCFGKEVRYRTKVMAEHGARIPRDSAGQYLQIPINQQGVFCTRDTIVDHRLRTKYSGIARGGRFSSQLILIDDFRPI